METITLRAFGGTENLVLEDDRILHPGLGEITDATLDTVGGAIRLHMLRRLRTAGRLVLLGNASGDDIQLYAHRMIEDREGSGQTVLRVG